MRTLILIFLLAPHFIKAQQDTSFALVRSGTPGIFSYKKFSSAEQLKNARGTEWPQYSFSENQFNRIKGLLDLFVNNESEFIRLRKNLDERDSLCKIKVNLYSQMDSIRELRAKNFEQAYHSLLLLNKQYDQQLLNCKELAIREARKSKFNSGMFGVLAGLTAGVIIGVALR